MLRLKMHRQAKRPDTQQRPKEPKYLENKLQTECGLILFYVLFILYFALPKKSFYRYTFNSRRPSIIPIIGRKKLKKACDKF